MLRGALIKSIATCIVVGLASSGCASPSTKGPTNVLPAEDLVGTLLGAEDLPGTWSVNAGPSGGGDFASGAVTDENRDKLPQIEFCERSSQDSRDVLRSVQWAAYRQIDKKADDPIKLPKDREGHMVFVQEWLASDESNRFESTFEDIAAAFKECLGDIPAGEEGPGTITEVEIEPIGDQRVAMLARFEEAGGVGFWNIYSVVVRTGTVLMSITAVDIALGDPAVESELPDLDSIISTAVSKIEN